MDMIKNLTDFIQQLSTLVQEDENLLYFRGHSKKKYKLIPSVYRKNYINNEDKIFRDIELYCPEDFKNCKTTFEKLVKMQHYDVPTRLLDITSNPLVALYFACLPNKDKDKDEDEDGVVIIFSINKNNIKYYDSDTVSVLSNLSRMKRDFFDTIDKVKKPNNFDFFTIRDARPTLEPLVYAIRDEKPSFKKNIRPEDLSNPLFVLPKLDNPRIIRQSGAFILFGLNDFKEEETPLNDCTSDIKLYISKQYKDEILHQLQKLNISQNYLFPEIDKVAEYIKSKL